jgi:hypothetical protein
MDRRLNPWLIILVAVAIWLVLSMLTDTYDPVEQVSQVIGAGMDLAAMQLTNAQLDSAGNCVASPDELASEAGATLGSPVTVEEYAIARMCASESIGGAKGSDNDKTARIWVALNDAAQTTGGDIILCLTGGNGFGPQGSLRKYATGRRDPTDYHLTLVRLCRSGAVPDPTGGSTHFMDKYGFADAAGAWDSGRYEEVVSQWQARGWTRVTTIGRGLEIWHE